MKAKQIVVVALIVVISSALSALVAYRLAVRQLPRALMKVVAPAESQPGITTGTAPGGTSGCVDFQDAGSLAGRTGCVSGRLLRVFTSKGGNTFLDFCENYRNCPFTSVIFTSDKSKFGDVGALSGRQLEIQGTITTYQGHAEIIIHDPQQIHPLP